jgi:hypothetical protein
MLDNDHAALAQVQNALVNAQQLYDAQKRKLDRLMAAGTPTHDATDALGYLSCISQSFNVIETTYSPPRPESVIRGGKRINATAHTRDCRCRWTQAWSRHHLYSRLLFFMVAPAGARESYSLRGAAVFSVEGPEISFAAVRTLGLAAHSSRPYPPLPHSPAPASTH